MRTLRFVTVTIVILATPAWAVAQVTLPDSVSIEFVQLLAFMPMMSRQAEVAVGRLPERLAADLHPVVDTRVVGSIGSRDLSVGALIASGQPREVEQRIAEQLGAAGWTRRPEVAESRGGFQSEPRQRWPTALCSPDDYSVQVTATAYTNDSSVVRLTLGREDMGISCRESEPTTTPFELDLPIPILRAPPGTEHRGGGSGGGGDDGHAEARLRTEMSPGSLLAHYARQMIEQGWQPITQATSEDVAIHVFRMMDANGVAWQSALYVTVLQNEDRDLYLRLTRVRQ